MAEHPLFFLPEALLCTCVNHCELKNELWFDSTITKISGMRLCTCVNHCELKNELWCDSTITKTSEMRKLTRGAHD